MPAETIYRSRNADVGTIESKDELDDLGSEAPGAGGIPIPVGYTHIRRVIVASSCDGAALGNLIDLIRLEGDGMENDEAIVVNGYSIPVATGTGNKAPAWVSPVLNFPVNPGASVRTYSEAFGDAESDLETGVTLELTKGKRPRVENKDAEVRTRSYTADVDTIDAVVDLTGDLGSDTNPSRIVPPGVTHLWGIQANAAYDEAADGSSVAFVRLRGDWLEGGPHTIMVLGRASIAGQAGSDEGVQRGPPFFLDDMMIPVVAGATIEAEWENAGDDPGNGTAGLTLLFV